MTEKPKLRNQVHKQDQDWDEDTLLELQEIDDIDSEEDEIVGVFDPEKIRVDARPMTIDLLLSRIRYDELDLAPDFQRHAGIWNNDVKSRLIESIIIRIPLPAFYMDATNEDKWLVVDGLQRLTALKQFVIDKKLKLTGLEYLKDYEGKTHDELPRNFQRRILETQVTVYLIEKGTPDEVKFNIFGRINTGGLPLTSQELRHAMNPGKAPNFLKLLAESPEFKQATSIKDSRKERMEDREFVLRFLAFKLTYYKNYKERSLKVFLNQAMTKLNEMTDQELKRLELDFKRTMLAAFDIFGEQAFRRKLYKKNPQKRSEPNRALFEAWSVNLCNLSEQQLEILKQRKEDLIDRFNYLVNRDEKFIAAISQGMGAVDKVKYRISKIENLIQEVL